MSAQPNPILPFFAKYIEKELGIVYAEHNYFQLENRLAEIAKLLSVASIEALYNQAQTAISGQFKQLLLDIATNNETSFFRDPKIFKAIETGVLPELTNKVACIPRVRIWSAASSSGQEALSLAMVVEEWCKKNNRQVEYKITGTDISERILAKAKSAKYTQLEVQRGLSAPLMVKYFKKDESDQWTASADLTRHTEFKKLNLMDPFNFSENFDLILCRNVLIYQSVERKSAILKKIHAALAPGGFLILGSGESLIGLSEDFSQVSAEGAVFYRKKDAALEQTPEKVA